MHACMPGPWLGETALTVAQPEAAGAMGHGWHRRSERYAGTPSGATPVDFFAEPRQCGEKLLVFTLHGTAAR